MPHSISTEDREFVQNFCERIYPFDGLDHRSHLRLAYIFLCGHDPSAALKEIRAALQAYLESNNVDPKKYHETLTHAWILAVRHFMNQTPDCDSSSTFINANPKILNSEIMLSHYSKSLLFSEKARNQFVEPDIEQIPRPGDCV